MLEERVAKLERDMEAVKSLLQKIAMAPGGTESRAQKMTLENVKTTIKIEEVENLVTINTNTIQGKILTVAKKGKLDNWIRLGEITKAIIEEGWTVSSQLVNNGLTDLVKKDIIAKKHTDRNYFKVAKNVTFKEE